MMSDKKTANPVVLVCPLDWGLGHAARCVPVIRLLIKKKCRLIIAADNFPLEFLKKEFSDEDIRYIVFPFKKVKYQKRGSFFIKLITQTPSLFYAIWKEHRQLKKIISETKADIVISDNRFGLWNSKIKSIFITHQIFIKAPKYFKWTETLLYYFNKFFFSRFDECWIPDYPGDKNLSGSLSHKKKIKGIRFIGALSRFSSLKISKEDNPLYSDFPEDFILVLLSGPEPQRSLLEEKIEKELNNTNYSAVILKGKPGSTQECFSSNRARFNHLPDRKMAYLIENSEIIICRSGYSTIMDLSCFNKKALLIPTPGQTEQEYLGKRLHASNMSFCTEQKRLNLPPQLDSAKKCKGIPSFDNDSSLLDNAVSDLLKNFD